MVKISKKRTFSHSTRHLLKKQLKIKGIFKSSLEN